MTQTGAVSFPTNARINSACSPSCLPCAGARVTAHSAAVLCGMDVRSHVSCDVTHACVCTLTCGRMQERRAEYERSVCPPLRRRSRRSAAVAAAPAPRHKHGGVCGAGVLLPASGAAAATSALARSFSKARISNTASKSPSLNCFAFRFKRERLFSAFFNSFATRFLSARKRACSCFKR